MLKIIALITMLIDHIGAVLFPGVVALRIIGRISFPIFAFSLTEGYIHTKNRKKYFYRLLLFSITSLTPYMLVFGGYKSIESFITIATLIPVQAIVGYLNIGFTFCFSFLTLLLIDKVKENKKKIKNYILIFMLLLMAEIIGVDYGIYGIITVMIFYIFRDNKKAIYLSFIITPLLLTFSSSIDAVVRQYASIIALPLIFRLKEHKLEENIKLPKWFFYIVYPLHLIILFIL